MGGRCPPPVSLPSRPALPAYPADEGGVGEGGPHVVGLEVVHVVEELWGWGVGEDQVPSWSFSLPLPSPTLQGEATQLKSLADNASFHPHSYCAEHWVPIVPFTVCTTPTKMGFVVPEV